MIEKLFSSQVMFKVLKALFSNRDASQSTTEIIKLVDRNQANIQRELDKLLRLGIVTREKKGQQNYYLLDQNYQFFKVLSDLFSVYSGPNVKYYLLNEESGSCLLSIDYMLRGFQSDYAVKKGVMNKIPGIIAVFKDDYGKYYFEEEIVESEAQGFLKKLLKNTSFVENIILKETIERGNEALEIFKKLGRRNFLVSKEEALGLIDQFLEIFCVQIGLNHVVAYDLKDQLYSNYLDNYLGHRLRGTRFNASLIMEKLLTPEQLTSTQLLRIELLRLAIKHNGAQSKSETSLKVLWHNWLWLNYGYMGPGLEWDYFQSIFNELIIKNKKDLQNELDLLLNNAVQVRLSKDNIFKQLHIDKVHRDFIKALSTLSYLKVYRKDTAFLLLYLNYKILEPLLPGLKKEDIFYLTIDEVKNLLRGASSISAKVLKQRRSYCAYDYSKERLLVGSKVDEQLRDLIREEQSNGHDGNLRLLEGTTACLGKTGDWVNGRVKIINTVKDINKMEEGDILVSVATTPDILPAMKMAAAIVTDHGGITCHAAIVSRELNIPCLIATKYATKLFKDGDSVVVCPRHRYIKFK